MAAVGPADVAYRSAVDPEIMTRQAHRLARWIDELAESQGR